MADELWPLEFQRRKSLFRAVTEEKRRQSRMLNVRPEGEEGDREGQGEIVEFEEEPAAGTYAKSLHQTFLPYRLLLILFGRWPMRHVLNDDGTYTYAVKWKTPSGFYFHVLTFYFIYILIGSVYFLGNALINLSLRNSIFVVNATRIQRSNFREGVTLQRHFVIVVSILTNILLSVITSINVIVKHQYTANYFSFWTRAVESMKMDFGKVAVHRCWIFFAMDMSTITVLAIMSIFGIGATASGGPLIMAMFTTKFFHAELMAETTLEEDIIDDAMPWVLTVARLFGGIGWIYLFICSKVFILIFLLKCELLKDGFAQWNGRVYTAILRHDEFQQSERGRTTFRLLFIDHCTLLDLLEGTNNFFAGVLESYFILSVGSVCFEFYLILWSSRYGHDTAAAERGGLFIREFDYIPAFLIFVVNMSILCHAAINAAQVGEEAIAGMEVIRRKTMLGRKTEEELHFMLSMYKSYTSYRRLEMNAGYYFYLDKSFVIGLMAATFTYFILLYQFQPQLDSLANSTLERRAIGRFLMYTEGVRECSWSSEQKC